jgi:hypothetical protein
LAAVLSTALISLQFTPPDERAGARPIPDKANLGTLGERLNANTIVIVSNNPNAWTSFPKAADWVEHNREKQSAMMTDAGSAPQPSLTTERPHSVCRKAARSSRTRSAFPRVRQLASASALAIEGS